MLGKYILSGIELTKPERGVSNFYEWEFPTVILQEGRGVAVGKVKEDRISLARVFSVIIPCLCRFLAESHSYGRMDLLSFLTRTRHTACWKDGEIRLRKQRLTRLAKFFLVLHTLMKISFSFFRCLLFEDECFQLDGYGFSFVSTRVLYKDEDDIIAQRHRYPSTDDEYDEYGNYENENSNFDNMDSNKTDTTSFEGEKVGESGIEGAIETIKPDGIVFG